MKIYLIDDDEVDLVIGKKLIQIVDSSADVLTTQSPTEALSNLLHQVIQPDVIILDWHMAEMDAIDWLEYYSTEIKELVPVYIFTASIDPRDRQKAEEFEIVKGFFIKPFSKLVIDKILPSYNAIKN